MHPYVLLRDQLPKSKGQKSQAFSFWIFTPGIALESWKILSGNFLFLELKNPGKFCPGRKLSWNFLKIIYIFPGIYSSGIFHSWNFPLLEFCPGTFCSWNLISRNFLVTPVTPSSPSQTLEGLFELTRHLSRTLDSPRVFLPKLQRYKATASCAAILHL